MITGEAPFDENRAEGNDIVTFVEESVEGGNILQLLDPSLISLVEEEQVFGLYNLANKCLCDKRNRLTSSEVLDLLIKVT